MAYTVRDLAPLVNITSSGGAAFSNILRGFDDASAITLYFISTTLHDLTSAILVTQFDSSLTSTAMYVLSSVLVTSSGMALTLPSPDFRGLQLAFTATSSYKGETLAYATKKISV